MFFLKKNLSDGFNVWLDSVFFLTLLSKTRIVYYEEDTIIYNRRCGVADVAHGLHHAGTRDHAASGVFRRQEGNCQGQGHQYFALGGFEFFCNQEQRQPQD
jgi:hypothetical protein